MKTRIELQSSSNLTDNYEKNIGKNAIDVV